MPNARAMDINFPHVQLSQLSPELETTAPPRSCKLDITDVSLADPSLPNDQFVLRAKTSLVGLESFSSI